MRSRRRRAHAPRARRAGRPRAAALVVPHHRDRVRSAIYLPFDESAARSWSDGPGNGGWIVGRGGLPAFLEQFDDRAYSRTAIAVLRAHLAARRYAAAVPAASASAADITRRPIVGALLWRFVAAGGARHNAPLVDLLDAGDADAPSETPRDMRIGVRPRLALPAP